VIGEQVVAPAHRRVQGAVTGVASRAARRRRGVVAEPLGDLGGCEVGKPARGQLERERDPIQPAADLQQGVAVLRTTTRSGRSSRLRSSSSRSAGGSAPSSESTGRGPTGQRCSPASRNGSREVTSTVRSEQRRADAPPVPRPDRAGARRCRPRATRAAHAGGRRGRPPAPRRYRPQAGPGRGARQHQPTGVQPARLRTASPARRNRRHRRNDRPPVAPARRPTGSCPLPRCRSG
jgi:hypothetical protein